MSAGGSFARSALAARGSAKVVQSFSSLWETPRHTPGRQWPTRTLPRRHPAPTARPRDNNRKQSSTTVNHRKLPLVMPDIFTPAKRSEVMSRIRSTGNAATELRLVALLRAAGITGWRRHVPLPLGLVPAPRSSSASSSDSSSPGHRSPKSAGGPGHRSSKRAGGRGLRSSQSEGGSAKGKAKVPASSSAAPRLRRLRVRPDFIFRAQRVAVFVDGCFWHGCPRHGTRPRQNRKFWDEKIARNRERDRLVTRRLRQRGWTVLRLWECALSPKRHPATLARLRRALEK